MSDLTPAERAELESILAQLHQHGYTKRDRFNELTPGARVRHRGHQWPEAFQQGTGVIVAITEKSPSAWSTDWGMADVEMVVAWDKPTFEDSSRLSQVAQYHVSLIARSTTHSC
jgi:hypothetical protein